MVASPRRDSRINVVAGIAVLAVAGAFLAPPIPQDPAYHDFADQRSIAGIPHFWNVVSNIPFTLAGFVGLGVLARKPRGVDPRLRLAYGLFFAAVALVGAGSVWYHLAPSNTTLVWDRLPMSLGFMAFFAIVVAEYISLDWGRRLLWPLIVIGAASVLWWHVTETRGAGDLRPYALVQFLPMLLVPLILVLYKPRYSHAGWLWAVIAAYGLAKIVEFMDAPVFVLLGGFSGHSLKHLLAASGPLVLALMIARRKAVAVEARSGG